MRATAPVAMLAALLAQAVLLPSSAAGRPGPTVTQAWAALERDLRGVALTGEKLVITADADGELRVRTHRIAQASDGRYVATTLKPAAERGSFGSDDLHFVRTYDAAKRRLVVRRNLSRPASQATVAWRLNLARRSYNLIVEGVEPVAGRQCLRLALDPYRRSGVTVRLWLDQATGAELRREETDDAGNSLQAEMFTSVAVLPPGHEPKLSAPAPRRAHIERISGIAPSTDLHELSRRAGFHISIPAQAPQGFEFEQATVATVDGRRAAVLRYTNGIAALTLVATPVAPRSATPPAHRSRRLAGGDWRLDWSGSDLDVVVMGPCAPDEMLAMLDEIDGAAETAFVNRAAAEAGVAGRTVAAMRGSGLSRETVHAILEVARRTGKPMEPIWAYIRAGHGWQSAATRFGVPPTVVQSHIYGGR